MGKSDEKTVEQLKDALRELDQPVSGSKDELQARLDAAQAAVAAAGAGNATADNRPADDVVDEDDVDDGPHVDPNTITIPPDASAADAPPTPALPAPARRRPVRDEANRHDAPPDVTAVKPAPPAITQTENMVRGLLIERAGYERAGDTEKLKLVDEQLKLYGYTAVKGRRSAPKSDA